MCGIFIGSEVMELFRLGNRRCLKFRDISGTKKNIIKCKAMKMNFAVCAGSMVSKSMSGTLGIKMFVAFSDGLNIAAIPRVPFASLIAP